MMDINCDLGEYESAAKTRALMRWITSANIACGGHAGDEKSMRRCLRLCREFAVAAGAHPGFEDAKNFGRKALPITAAELRELLSRQVGDFVHHATTEGVKVAHVKLHGALYHVVEGDRALARNYVAFVKRHLDGAHILGAAQGLVGAEAAKEDVTFWPEIYADRAYGNDGTLIPRKKPGAVLPLAAIRHRLEAYRILGLLFAQDGTPLDLPAQTMCIHSDAPNATRVARLLHS